MTCAVLGTGVYEEMAYIEWIYTDPSYRRNGAARALLKWLKILLRRTDVKILEISFQDENENLEDFLDEERFFYDEDREIYSVPVRDLIYSDIIDTAWEGHSTDCIVTTFKEYVRC